MLCLSFSNILRVWIILSIVVAVVANPVPQANKAHKRRHPHDKRGGKHRHHKHRRITLQKVQI